MNVSFGKNTNIGSAKYVPYLYDRIKNIVLNTTNIDNVTTGLEDSQLYIKRDSASADIIFGELNDMTSLYNDIYSNPLDTTEYIFKSSNIRRAPSTDTNNSYASLNRLYNIESVDSVSAFTVGNIVLGPSNILEIPEDDGYTIDNSIAPSVDGNSGTILFLTGQGDLRSYYVVGQKILVYVKYNTTETKGIYYYITGTITSSTFSTYTTVVFTTDFIFSQGIFLNLMGASVDGHLLRAVSYTAYTDTSNVIGSSGNIVYGGNNILRGRENFIIGSSNSVVSGVTNIILGSNFKVEPTNVSYLGTRGNILIGDDGSNSDNIIASHGNLIIENNNLFSVVQINHTSSAFNNLVGNSNYIGTGSISETVGYTNNNLFGIYNSAQANYTNIIGLGGKSTTNGEIVLSASSSPVKKSIFLLEGLTTSTSAKILKTLARSYSSAGAMASNIYLTAGHAFSGTCDLVGYTSAGESYRNKLYINWYVDSSGVCQTPIVSSPSEYTYTSSGMVAPTIAFTIPGGTAAYFEFTVTPGSATATRWVASFEGTILDYMDII